TAPHPTDTYTLSLHDALPICRSTILTRTCWPRSWRGSSGPPDRSRRTQEVTMDFLSRTQVVTAFGAVALALFVLDLVRRRRLSRSEEHTSELQSRFDLVCRLL